MGRPGQKKSGIEPKAPFGVRVGIALSQSGYVTRAAFLKELGLSANAFNLYERGLRVPNGDVIVRMAELLGTSTDYLLGYTPPDDERAVPQESGVSTKPSLPPPPDKEYEELVGRVADDLHLDDALVAKLKAINWGEDKPSYQTLANHAHDLRGRRTDQKIRSLSEARQKGSR